jgi:hypothetical protein
VALLGLQDMNLKVHKDILVEELERGLHPPDGVGPVDGAGQGPRTCGLDHPLPSR